MSAVPNRFKQAKPRRPRRCETQRLFVPSMPERSGVEPRHSAPSGGSVVRASSATADAGAVTSPGTGGSPERKGAI